MRCLVLTGAGRGFCAGQDLADRAVAPGSDALDLGASIENYYKPLLLRLRRLRMPTICAVNGVAAGAGANIPFACDLVFAAKSASFIQSFSKLGLVPDCGGTWWLPRLLGPARAMGLALLGDKLSSAQAEAWGLIWRCVEDDELMPTALAAARQFAAGPTRGYVRTRAAMEAGLGLPFEAALDLEREYQHDALARGAESIATGYYVGKGTDAAGRATLLRARDANKDQSYFLYRLSQAQVRPALFPLANLPKPEVRQIAQKIGLPNAAKKDSTGICFIGERNLREFLERYLPRDPGEMKTPEGRVVGQHQGLMYYTLGQRQGLGIGGQKDGNTEPWFVAAKDMATNTLVVVQGHDHPLLQRSSLAAGQVNWISGVAPDTSKPYTAKTRYRQIDAPCRITRFDGDTLELGFDAPQWAVTPGQSVVFRLTTC